MGCHFYFIAFVIVIVELILRGRVLEKLEPFIVKCILIPLIFMKGFISIRSVILLVICEANPQIPGL